MKYKGSNVDLVPILADIGIIGRHQGRELVTHCPFHSDKSPSFAVNLETGLWVCYTGCGKGNIHQLAQRMGYPRVKLDMRLGSGVLIDADELIKDFLNPPTPATEEEAPPYYVAPIDVYKAGVMPKWFLQRGFDADIITRWDIRYDQLEKAVVIPAFDDYGTQVATIKRYPSSVAREKGIAKYRYTTGFQKAKHLFGMNRYAGQDTVALVEGPLDCIWVWENWGPCLAILGARISAWQMNWLRQLDVKEIVLALDNDDAGREQTYGKRGRDGEQQVPALTTMFSVYTSVIDLPRGVKDVQECAPEVIHKVFENRRHSAIPPR